MLKFEFQGLLSNTKYIDKEHHTKLLSDYEEVRKMLISMINNPEKFCK